MTGGFPDDKASVPEALIPEMRRQLAELDELVKAGDGRARRRKNITAKADVVLPGQEGRDVEGFPRPGDVCHFALRAGRVRGDDAE